MMWKLLIVLQVCCLCLFSALFAQRPYWQQRADYHMQVELDVNTHRFSGSQEIVYQNNSPDTITKAYYHLYFNAFQPGSMMDVRSRTIADPDQRVRDRIAHLGPDEIGYLKALELKQDKKDCTFRHEGTILEVELPKPLLPGKQCVLSMKFEGQVPLQIRRSGRDNREGIAYSMAQWYPKLCEYDDKGWHPNPYVGREFYGVWGDFDVKITLDASYTVAATGYLQNPDKIGHGYESAGTSVKAPKGDRLTWHFVAPKVHDFVWAADPDFVHKTAQVPNGPLLHFFYEEKDETKAWEELPAYAVKAFEFINQHFGRYPYQSYSIIQGGDGGMEYPMATLITGHRRLRSLVGVTVHEVLHSWYQMVLATNESLYPWMDEGFTSYASAITMQELFPPKNPVLNPLAGSYGSYFSVVKAGLEEPMSTHSDHYHTNRAYGMAAYSKGAITLAQLGYIISDSIRDRGLLRYYNTWKFRHPTPDDFLRIMEKESGMVLDWYLEHWMNTTNTIDYGIRKVWEKDGKAAVALERIGSMPMPVDLMVTYKDGSRELHHIPLRIMRGAKPREYQDAAYLVRDDWPWTHPFYELQLSRPVADIQQLEIDPSTRMADVDRENNLLQLEEGMNFYLNAAGGH